MYNIFAIINGNTCTNYGTIYKYNYNEISFEEKFKFIENKIEDCINYFFSSSLKISNSAFRYESLSYFSLKKETKTRTSLTRVSYTMETYDIDALCILSFLSISRHFQRRVIRYTVSYLHGTMFNLWNTKRIGLLVIVNLEESWGKVFPLVETFPPAGDLPFCSLFIFVAERCRRTL